MAKLQTIKINPNRPLEELVGQNRWVVRHKLGRIHLANSLKHALRETRPKGMRTMPVELRRGWVLCTINTWNEFKNDWIAVTTGNLGQPKLGH
jgi:hypothetical protein